ncbi:MAG: hydrolase [Flavobacteriaceae bacterium]|nr:carbohydrate binding family 9 domain-containing protein [Flavobacteriaceae bacterium]RZV67170.1 MAG: hydrolase [Flavobacteriaceae bacterium]
MKKVLFAFLGLLLCSTSFSQTKKFTVKYVKQYILADGVLDEPAWETAIPATDFFEYFPTDTIQARQQAEIKMMFDDDNLYIGAKVYSPTNKFIIPSLRRDFRASGNDNITFMFDTFRDGTNAFIFGSNPYGVQREFLLSGGGSDIRGFNSAWDTKWVVESKIHEDHYVLEFIIPLSAFKYREGETKWRFNSYHFDTEDNERNTWVNIPQNQFIFNLAYMGEMIFEKPLGKSKSPISLIPYLNGLVGKDFEEDETISDFGVGGDAKMTIGNSLNLDVTFNPDFSQVEVDQQVTNLTRFEIGLPERRQFFIENSDLFSDFGDRRDANPFFSRRIGIAKDLDDNSIQNDIIAGARLSGKLNNNLRIGVLNMQTAEDKSNEIASTNNALVMLQYKMFSRSNLNVFFINKQATKDYDFLADEDRYNRVIGVDYNLASKDNTWNGKYYIHKSFSPDSDEDEISTGASTEYNSRSFRARLSGLYIGDNFRSDLGFIRRSGIFKINPQLEKLFWPVGSAFNRHSLSVTPIFVWAEEGNYINSDYTIITRWQSEFRNQASFSARMFNRFTYLFDPFDPTGTDGAVELPGDQGYYYTSYEMEYQSDMRKEISFNINPGYGSFYNGDKLSIETRLNWRLQPYFATSIQVNFDKINLPDPYPDASLWLIGPRFDVTFSKNIFWSTFVQYSTQQENFSINTRLQWRFAPLSDLFIVYNDNYFADGVFAPRFRTLNAKLTYWLNL